MEEMWTPESKIVEEIWTPETSQILLEEMWTPEYKNWRNCGPGGNVGRHPTNVPRDAAHIHETHCVRICKA